MISRWLFCVSRFYSFSFFFFQDSPVLCVIVAVYTDILRDDVNDGPRYNYGRYFALLGKFALTTAQCLAFSPFSTYTYTNPYIETSRATYTLVNNRECVTSHACSYRIQTEKTTTTKILKTFSKRSVVWGASSVWMPYRLLKRPPPPTHGQSYQNAMHAYTDDRKWKIGSCVRMSLCACEMKVCAGLNIRLRQASLTLC